MTTAPQSENGRAGAGARFVPPSLPTNSDATENQVVEWHLVGRVGVDSGQLVIVDPSYLDGWASDDYAKVEPVDGLFPLSYSGACSASMSNQLTGVLGTDGIELAVSASSGWGDGIYPVYVRYNVSDGDRRVVELRVDFTDSEAHYERLTRGRSLITRGQS